MSHGAAGDPHDLAAWFATAKDPHDLPLWALVATAVLPVVFVGLEFIAHPVAWVAVAGLVTVSPWLLTIARVPLPGWVCEAIPLCGTAWLMAAWRHTDLVLMLLVYLVGQTGAIEPPRVAVTTWLVAVAVPMAWQVADGYDRWPAWIIGMTFACACGVTFGKQQETLERLRHAQEELGQKAAADERRRIAREVHDLVAHSLAVTMLHLTGARLALADGETAEAEAALASAERLGRSSMTGIRQAVGLLAESGDAVSWSPNPDAGDVPDLVEDYRRAGVDVALTETGTATPLEPAVGLAVFRILQESLANAVRHAPGRPVLVQLDWTPAELVLTVANDVVGVAVPSPTGHGLVGMRERVEQLGGRFAAGATDGRWLVEAALPSSVDAETATP